MSNGALNAPLLKCKTFTKSDKLQLDKQARKQVEKSASKEKEEAAPDVAVYTEVRGMQSNCV